MTDCRINVEVSQEAMRKLLAEVERRRRADGRGKLKYPMWRIIDDLLRTLPDPEDEIMAAAAIDLGEAC